MAKNSGRFHFDGGAGTYIGTGILAVLITVFTLGICYPFALVLKERWRAKHSYIDGQRLVFTGSAIGLFGNWIKWLLLSVVTFGIYLFWVGPRIARWKWEHTDFDPTSRANALPGHGGVAAGALAPVGSSPELGAYQVPHSSQQSF
jgi:uncharacterized membrane protein YjgN (DUF898 family)